MRINDFIQRAISSGTDLAHNTDDAQLLRGRHLYRSADGHGLLDLSKSRFFQLRAAGLFPKPDIVLGARTLLWRRSTVLRWIAEHSKKEADHAAA